MFLKVENSFRISIIVLGFTSLITQIILLREFLTVFYGNELVVGIILANWMLLTGLGAYLGKFSDRIKNRTNLTVVSHILLGILPIITVFLIYYLKNIVFPIGKILNPGEIFLGSFVLLFPFCVLSGFLFTCFSSYFSELFKSNQINKVYALEALGSIVGGLLFNLLFVFVLNTFFSLSILIVLNLFVSAIHLFRIDRKIISYSVAILGILLTILIINVNHEKYILKYLYPNQEILHFDDTPYGNIVVTKTAEQYNFYENGVSIFSTDNIIANEENVHYAMVQHPNPENVLLISGGVSGTINEILKYRVSSLDYLELNPAMIEVGEMYTSNIINDSAVSIFNKDARLFIKKENEKKYDVVLINLPDPTSAQINRYFTLEFFEELKNKLKDFAVISISLSSTSNYISEESRQIHSSLFSTLQLIFKNIIIIPGNRNYFLASDRQLSYEIGEIVDSKHIETSYVNKYYLDDEKISDESKIIENAISNDVEINYDFEPIIYFLQLKYWLSLFNLNFFLIGFILLIAILIAIFRMNYINTGLFITGFSASSIEIILIIAFQVIYGYVYQMIGVFITIFMFGLAVGAIYLIKKVNTSFRNYSIFQYLIGIFSVLITIILFTLKSNYLGNFFIYTVFIVLIFLIGLLTGIQFSLATKLRTNTISTIAATAYGSDLLGSAIGAILVASFLIPWLGIIKVALILGILNILTGLFILLKAKNRS